MNQFCHGCTYIKNDSINPPTVTCPICGGTQWDDAPPLDLPGTRQLPSGGWTIDVTPELIPLQSQWRLAKWGTSR